ncbi:hypothetical protein SESBI_38583 [Sesbania bispinosa]|nr:hypothetical protein SESBI_38583 [Sesbania bispinosa]
MKLKALHIQINNLSPIPQIPSHRCHVSGKSVHGEFSGALDEETEASGPLMEKTHDNLLGEEKRCPSLRGGVSNNHTGQRTGNNALPEPHDELTVQQSGSSMRPAAFPACKAHASAFATSQVRNAPLDGDPLFPAQSEPHTESTIRVIALPSPKDAPKPLHHGSSTKHKSQPPHGDTIRVIDQDSANLVDKVFEKGGGIDRNTELGLERPKRNTKKPSWMKNFV